MGKKKIRIKQGPNTVIRETDVSDDGDISLDKILTDRIIEVDLLLVDGIEYLRKGKECHNLSTCVEIEGKDGKIFQGEYPVKVKIVEIDVVYLRKTDKAEETNQQPAEDFSPLKQTITTAAEVQETMVAETTEDLASKVYVHEPTQEQLRHLADVIGRSREEGREEGHTKARLEIKALEYEANTITNDLEAKLKQKTEEHANITKLAKLAKWLVEATYAKGREILEDHELSMKTMEEMCEGYTGVIKGNETTISELTVKISRLENEVSGIKKNSAEESKGREGLMQQIRELQSERDILDSENRLYGQTQKETEAQMKELQEAKEALEREYNQSGDNFREEIESAKRKHVGEIKGYQDMLVKEREILSKIYGRMARLAGLEPGTHPRQSFSAIELYLLQRQKLLEEVDGLRKAITLQAEKASARESYPPEKTMPQPIPLNKERPADLLQKAAEYVILSMYISNKGEIEATLDKITDMLTRFELIDPQKVGLSKKDIKILSDYFTLKCQGYSQGPLSDTTMLVGNFIDDEIKPFLNNPLLLDGASRVMIRKDLQEDYDRYKSNPQITATFK